MECRRCKKQFKSSVIIEGKRKSLSKRVYCLNCSPWGSHNTRKIYLTDEEKKAHTTATCKYCNKQYIRAHGRYKERCNTCRGKKFRQRLKKELVEKMGGKCFICSYDKCIEALDFHHLDPNKKEMPISTTSSRYLLLKEVEKCMLVCCRCHREIHAGLI
jgi:hypothetical protein